MIEVNNMMTEEAVTTEIIAENIYDISNRDKLVLYAKTYVGTPYRYGGTGPSGFDCSGFVSTVFKNNGISLARSSSSQYWSNGTKISQDKLQPGDLVFYGYGSSVSHVAIYIGDNKIVHSSSSRGVVIDNMMKSGLPPVIGYKSVMS
ncbi:MAG: hypothetical protein BEN19_07235 [Epulopiscium sp. Nuni2H_MBin003]|nr:MAG: hypothetical protein BEN19_07235 [Epulopiscium sp. Nuni2H_MBin003]